MSDSISTEDSTPKYFNDDKSKLICQYCLAEMKVITPSHLKHHDMTMADYKERFPMAPLKMKSNKKKETVEVEKKKTSIKITIPPNTTNVPTINKKIDGDKILLTREDVIDAVRQVYPTVEANYVFKKLNLGGHILYTVMTDFGDTAKRVMIDFSGMQWHVSTPLLTKFRKQELLSESKWKYIHISEETITMNDIIKILKSK